MPAIVRGFVIPAREPHTTDVPLVDAHIQVGALRSVVGSDETSDPPRVLWVKSRPLMVRGFLSSPAISSGHTFGMIVPFTRTPFKREPSAISVASIFVTSGWT